MSVGGELLLYLCYYLSLFYSLRITRIELQEKTNPRFSILSFFDYYYRGGAASGSSSAGSSSSSSSSSTIDFGLQAERLRARSAEISEEDGMLTETVNALLNEMQLLLQDHEHKELAYVQQKDLRNLAIFENMTVIAVRAPPGTRMEVPDPVLTPGAPSFQVYLRSESGPVNFYLVSKAQDVQPTSSSSSSSALLPHEMSSSLASSSTGPYLSAGSMIGSKIAENWPGIGATASSGWISGQGLDSQQGEGDMFGSSSTANASPMAVYANPNPNPNPNPSSSTSSAYAASEVPILVNEEDFGGSRKRKRVEEEDVVGTMANVSQSHLHQLIDHGSGQLGIDESGYTDAVSGNGGDTGGSVIEGYSGDGQSGLYQESKISASISDERGSSSSTKLNHPSLNEETHHRL